jgi:hypothetical protein
MFPSKPTISSKIPNDVTGGRLYTLKIFELNGKLYIKDNVIVKDNEDKEVQSYAGSPAYEVFADGQSVPSSIAGYVQEQNMFVDKPTEIITQETENNKDTTNPVDSSHSDVESNIAPQIDIQNDIVPNPNITDSQQLDTINDENKPVNRSSKISRTGPISRVNDIPKNETEEVSIDGLNSPDDNEKTENDKTQLLSKTQHRALQNNTINNTTRRNPKTVPFTQIEDPVLNPIIHGNTQGGGINQYVYNRVRRAYPKNVSFSKRNPQKKHNKKTIRKLQNIINNV